MSPRNAPATAHAITPASHNSPCPAATPPRITMVSLGTSGIMESK